MAGGSINGRLTVRQISKLETVIGKLEALQLGIPNGRVADLLAEAKSKLIRALHAE